MRDVGGNSSAAKTPLPCRGCAGVLLRGGFGGDAIAASSVRHLFRGTLDTLNVNVIITLKIEVGRLSQMSITLSIPPTVVQEARAYASANGTTMSRMIREYFIGLVNARNEDRNDGGCRFLELARQANVKMPKGWRFNREACYERSPEQ